MITSAKDLIDKNIFIEDFFKDAFQVVERTARYGLQQSKESPTSTEKWLLIWSAEVAGELGEVWEQIDQHRSDNNKLLIEVGDVIWSIGALGMLLDFKPSDFNSKVYFDVNTLADSVKISLRLLEMAKKVSRDGLANRPIDRERVLSLLVSIFRFLEKGFDVTKALSLVDAKLLARYPDGYSAERSVNRQKRPQRSFSQQNDRQSKNLLTS
jgi:hypothetical protein